MKTWIFAMAMATGFATQGLQAQTTDFQIINRYEEHTTNIKEQAEREAAEMAFQSAVISTAYRSGDNGAILAIQDRFNVGPNKAAGLFDGAMRYFENEAVEQGLIAERADAARLTTEAGVTVAGLVGVVASGGTAGMGYVAGTVSGGSMAAGLASTGAGVMAFSFKTASLVKEWSDHLQGRSPVTPSEGVQTLNNYANGFAALATTSDASQISNGAELMVVVVSAMLNPEVQNAEKTFEKMTGIKIGAAEQAEVEVGPRELKTEWLGWDLAKPERPSRFQTFTFPTPGWARQVLVQVEHGYDNTGDRCAMVEILTGVTMVSGEACSRGADDFIVQTDGKKSIVVTVFDTDTETDDSHPGNGGELRLIFTSERDN